MVTHTESVPDELSEDYCGEQSEDKEVSTAPNGPKLGSRRWFLQESEEKSINHVIHDSEGGPQTYHRVVPPSVSFTHSSR